MAAVNTPPPVGAPSYRIAGFYVTSSAGIIVHRVSYNLQRVLSPTELKTLSLIYLKEQHVTRSITMRASVYYFALAGLTTLSQASPIANPDPPTDPRGLITRSLPNLLTPGSETLPTKRQSIPSAQQAAAAAAGQINNATRNVTLVVEKGDTLGQIAKLLNSGICDIAKQNKIADPNFILPGQKLDVTINLANPDNNSCLNLAGAIPPANNSTGSGGDKKDGKKNKN
ncbi:uncharacterized protein LY79DRAFT_697537 [Colletotrichum navitas]|uniref:LysM domain-containing protein n=1 Tax=Colletotrichum navitas TaxID=681940 RepID=A0AAD8PPP5_9PEZI|nr:uncharacterized protein LY79DRAFT_697537 [Colletotrichum navitas]KAK1573413.1 hypothetical protein LY79DRAFT_697537 [Colletotrichum navitas]